MEKLSGISARTAPPRRLWTGVRSALPMMSKSAISIAALASGAPTTARSARASSRWTSNGSAPTRMGPEMDVQRGGSGLDGTGEDGPGRGLAPAVNARIGVNSDHDHLPPRGSRRRSPGGDGRAPEGEAYGLRAP